MLQAAANSGSHQALGAAQQCRVTFAIFGGEVCPPMQGRSLGTTWRKMRWEGGPTNNIKVVGEQLGHPTNHLLHALFLFCFVAGLPTPVPGDTPWVSMGIGGTCVGRWLLSLCVQRWASLEHPKRVNNSWTSGCHMHLIWHAGWEEMCRALKPQDNHVHCS